MTARRRFEIQSHGVDEFHQGFGTDPFGGQSWLGLRVPFKPTLDLVTPPEPPWKRRYMFQGAAFSVAEGSIARIIGYRQLYTLGIAIPASGSRIIPRELDVTAASFSFVDATVSWHFRRLGGPNFQGIPSFRPSSATDLANARRGFSMQPALLYDKIVVPAGNPYYTNLTDYTPPNGGRPWGFPLTDNPEMSDVFGLSTDWRTPDAWGSLDVEVRGPDTVFCIISAAQTDPDVSQGVAPPFTNPGGEGLGVRPEDAFIENAGTGFGLPVFNWRVGVSLIVETDSIVSEIRAEATS